MTIRDPHRFERPHVTDVDVLQEILHRYSAIKRLDAVQPAFDAILDVVDEVLPVHLLEVPRTFRHYDRVTIIVAKSS